MQPTCINPLFASTGRKTVSLSEGLLVAHCFFVCLVYTYLGMIVCLDSGIVQQPNKVELFCFIA